MPDSRHRNVELQVGPKEGGKGDGPLAPAAPVSWEAGKTKVLIIGGGISGAGVARAGQPGASRTMTLSNQTDASERPRSSPSSTEGTVTNWIVSNEMTVHVVPTWSTRDTVFWPALSVSRARISRTADDFTETSTT